MKTAADPRHQKRQQQIKALYTYSLSPKQIHSSISKIIPHLSKINSIISKSAPDWPVNQINKIDLAILRLATYEILYVPSIPHKVTIDEAVEIAKTYGSQKTPSFVNGVLGNIIKKHQPPKKKRSDQA